MNNTTASIVAVICTLMGVVFGAGIGICILFIREKADRERKKKDNHARADYYMSLSKMGKMDPEDIFRRERQHS